MPFFTKTLSKNIRHNTINEKTLNQFVGYIKNHDTAIITAYLPHLTKDQNEKRHQILTAKLVNTKRYWVIVVNGLYIENFGLDDNNGRNSVSVSNPSSKSTTNTSNAVKTPFIFVVDREDSGNLASDIIEFGKLFKTQNVLIIPKLKTKDDDQAASPYLYGTREGAFPGLDKKYILKDVKIETEDFFIKGKYHPFIFEPHCKFYYIYYPSSMFGLMAFHKILKDEFDK